jgi:hypothetical protein
LAAASAIAAGLRALVSLMAWRCSSCTGRLL